MRHAVARAAAGLLAAGLAASACTGDSGSNDSSDPEPALVAKGREKFVQACAVCHGASLEGTATGPSFLSPIYAPNHHPDAAFFSAARNGVQPHHWKFGPMPPVTSVTEDDVRAIVAYVRAKQAEAGITEDPSHR
jgi:mono/diheme cytochrome c family protein